MAGVIETTRTFASTELVTSIKLNEIISETAFTGDAITGSTLQVSTGKLKVSTGGITSNELASSSVTPAKLSGAQSGSAPVFGIRAYGSFDGSVDPVTLGNLGNIATIAFISTGNWLVTFTTPMANTLYTVVVNCIYGATNAVNASAGTKTTSSFIITTNSNLGVFNSTSINFVVIT
jgi:hypothetical protein